MIRRRLSGSLAAKLLTAQLLVIVSGSVTLLVVALSVAPGLFHSHVRDALGTVPADVADHLDRAFNDSVLLALAIAVGAALLTSGAVSWFLSRRIVLPIRALASAARGIARGAYSERVPVAGSDELADLGTVFNEMAGALESAERRRRELMSDVAHELRTPLATIEGYLEGISEGVIAPDAETWRTLQTEAHRLSRLVADLDKVSRAEERQLALRVEPTAPGALVTAAISAARPAYAAKAVELQPEIEPRLPELAVDPDRIGEVLGNLLDNALRHTPAGGRVEVAARWRDGAVELSVIDTGEGIAPEHLDRVLERFWRADPARTRERGGSGIGLTIARALVEAHGGRIRAESEGPGRGARFAVTLPLGR